MLKTIFFDLGVAAVFLAMITVLVFAHELGHYLFARLFGMGVEEFAIGFGPRPLCIYARRSYQVKLTEPEADEWEAGHLRPKPLEGGALVLEAGDSEEAVLERTPDGPILKETTRFTVRVLPLGGFVRIKGMMPEEDGGETKIPGGFYRHPPIQRLVVLFAGPLFSVLAGLVILVPYLMIVGEPVPNSAPIIGIIAPGGAADKAGLKVGDRLLTVGGVETPDFFTAVRVIRDRPGIPIQIKYERDGKTSQVEATPKQEDEPSAVLGPDMKPTDEKRIQGKLGFYPAITMKPMPVGNAVAAAAMIPVSTVSGLFSDAAHPKHFSEDVGGPVAIVQVTADATREGFGRVISLAALLSISLGIFNLLPIPPLDGGQMIMSLAELLRGGRRLSLKAQGLAVSMGFGVVAMLVIGVMYIDIHRFFSPAGSNSASSAAQKK